MIRKTLSLGMLAAALGMGVGCTQQTNTTKNKTAYYHDHRRVPTGSNLPKTYHDSGTGADEHQSDMDREQFQNTTNRLSNGGVHSGGG